MDRACYWTGCGTEGEKKKVKHSSQVSILNNWKDNSIDYRESETPEEKQWKENDDFNDVE